MAIVLGGVSLAYDSSGSKNSAADVAPVIEGTWLAFMANRAGELNARSWQGIPTPHIPNSLPDLLFSGILGCKLQATNCYFIEYIERDFVEARNKFSLLRKILGAIGLSPEAVDDIIDRITDFLSDKGDKSAGEPVYPYVLSGNFLSPAEHNFFSVLKTTVAD